MGNYLENSRKYKGFSYKSLTKDQFNYIHKKSIEMFILVKNIFDLNKINYFLCGGTLLGAYTKKQFIPWDDDFDLCIHEEDYPKAHHYLSKSLPKNIVLQSSETDKGYYLGWIKVRDLNSQVEPSNSLFLYNGIWLDIYKLKKTNLKNVHIDSFSDSVNYLSRRLACGGIDIHNYELRFNHLLKSLKENSGSNLKINSELYLILSASKVIVEKKWLYPRSLVKLAGIDCFTFSNPKAYLVSHYGSDFYNTPEESERRISISNLIIKK
jgi:lipopolysaccharide cholinephosphotransferase